MAIVGVPPADRVTARTDASTDAEELKRLFVGTSLWVEALGEEVVGPDGSTWRYITASDSRAVDGWVDATQLVELEGDTGQPDELFEAATATRAALSLERPHNRLADLTATVQVSADGVFSDDDAVIEAAQLSDLGGTDPIEDDFNFGPGLDGVETLTTEVAFFEALRNSPAIRATERVLINTQATATGVDANVDQFFPDATTVELFATTDGRWESVLLVFQVRDRGGQADGYELFGLALNGGVLEN